MSPVQRNGISSRHHGLYFNESLSLANSTFNKYLWKELLHNQVALLFFFLPYSPVLDISRSVYSGPNMTTKWEKKPASELSNGILRYPDEILQGRRYNRTNGTRDPIYV